MPTVHLICAVVAGVVLFVVLVLAVLRAAALPTPRPESGSEDQNPPDRT
jgi:hypothetical protein